MSDISIPGVSSKYNTTKLVEDLVEAEKIRLTRMEDEKETFETERSTWRQLNRDFGELQRTAKALYGFENPFSEKKTESSDERIITATASRNAPLDEYSVTVKQVATADRFLSPSLDRDFRVSAGTYQFRVGEESLTLRYRGGTLNDFARRITEKGEGLLRASTVRDTSRTQVLMIEAIPTGSENRLIFEQDARQLALDTGLMQPAPNQDTQLTLPTLSAGNVNATLRSSILTSEGVYVPPQSQARISIPDSIEDSLVLEFRYRTAEWTSEDLSPPQAPGALWPKGPDGRFGNITITGEAPSLQLPTATPWSPPERTDIRQLFFLETNSGESIELPEIIPGTEWQTLRVEASELPPDLTGLLIDNPNTYRGIEVAEARLYDPSRQGDLVPAKPVESAGDALLDFRGIEVRRSTNSIDDLVDGLTLNLKRPSHEPVDLSVTPDTETAKEGVIRFVFAYNQLLTRILVLTDSSDVLSDKQSVLDELDYLEDDEREKLEEQQGLLRGDFTITQLKNRLQGIVSSPYPTRAEEELALLAQVGVSTNASSGSTGGSFDQAKLRGFLEIDEEVLDSALSQNIDAVKDLFGRDTSGDLIIDNGVGQKIDEYLTPYTQTGGFVSNRISRIDTQIEGTQDDIDDYKVYLEEYEADLKRQYGRMESMMNQLEQSAQGIENFTNQQNNGR